MLKILVTFGLVGQLLAQHGYEHQINHAPHGQAFGHVLLAPDHGRVLTAHARDIGHSAHGERARSAEIRLGEFKRGTEDRDELRQKDIELKDGRSDAQLDQLNYKRAAGAFYERGGKYDHVILQRTRAEDARSLQDAGERSLEERRDKTDDEQGAFKFVSGRDYGRFGQRSHDRQANVQTVHLNKPLIEKSLPLEPLQPLLIERPFEKLEPLRERGPIVYSQPLPGLPAPERLVAPEPTRAEAPPPPAQWRPIERPGTAHELRPIAPAHGRGYGHGPRIHWSPLVGNSQSLRDERLSARL